MNIQLPRVNFEAAKLFLEILDPVAESFHFQTFDDVIDGQKRRKDSRLVCEKAEGFDHLMPELVSLNNRGAGIYVTINETDGKGRKAENIIRARAIWGDFDKGFPERFPLPPSLIVKTSLVNGVQKGQALWLVDERTPLSAEEHLGMIQRIVRDYGGDPGAALYNQVLRLPGFYHVKNAAAPQQVTFETEATDADGGTRQYRRSELMLAFPPLPKTRPNLPTEKADVPLFELDLPQSCDEVRFYLKHNAPLAIQGNQGDKQTLLVAMDCRDRGVSESMTLELMTEGGDESWNGRCEPPWDVEELQTKIHNAWACAKKQPGNKSAWNEFLDVFNDPVEITDEPDAEDLSDFESRMEDLTTEIGSDQLKVRAWIAKGHLMRGKLTALIAPGGVGKSLVTLHWGIALARGNGDFIGFNVIDGPKNVCIVNLEDDREEQKLRLAATLQHHEIEGPELGGRLKFYNAKGVGFKLVGRNDKKQLKPTAQLKKLLAFIQKNKFDVVMIDPLVEIHDGSENDNSEMAQVMSAIRQVMQIGNASGLLIHHTAKPPQAGSDNYAGNQNAARGASAIINSVRMALTLFSMSNTEAKALGVPENLKRFYARLDDAKANYHMGTGSAVWLKRVTVNLKIGEATEDVGVYELAKLDDTGRVKAVSEYVRTSVQDLLRKGQTLSPKPKAPNNISLVLFKAQAGTDFTRAEIENAVELFESAGVFDIEEYESKGWDCERYKMGPAVDFGSTDEGL
jgi:hypothetical protein